MPTPVAVFVRRGRFRFDPVAEAAKRAVGGNDCADGSSQRIEQRIAAVARLDHHLQFGPVFVEPGQWRQRHLGFPRLAVAQDDQAGCRNALGQHFPAQHGGGKGLQPRVQGGEDGFAGGASGGIRGG